MKLAHGRLHAHCCALSLGVVIFMALVSMGSANDGVLLRGAVVDTAGSVVPGAKATLHGPGGDVNLTSSERGLFETWTAPGIYDLVVRKDGYCPSRRPSFRALPGFHFTVVMVPCPSANVLLSDIREMPKESELSGVRPFSEDTIKPQSARSPFDLLVRYGQKKEDRGDIEFYGSAKSDPQEQVRVTAQFNSFTIRADKLILLSNRRTLIAIGNVEYEDGFEIQKQGQRFEADIVGSEQLRIRSME